MITFILKKIIIERDYNTDLIYWNLLKFKVGDVLIVFFWIKGIFYRFEGICIRAKKKCFLNSDTSFTLRNVLFGVGIEVTISYYYNRAFNKMLTLDYKRKKFLYRKSKLYYLRTKMNRASRVK